MIIKQDGTSDSFHTIRSNAIRDKQKIATTNGVFDLLHVGHIRFLQSIKKIADVLIVCVNSDESVRRLKGEGRPIQPLAERMEILDALEYVDYVVAFEEDTPCEIMSKIKPNIHAKDWDYATKHIAEKATVDENGGQMVLLPRLYGYGTTKIIQKVALKESNSEIKGIIADIYGLKDGETMQISREGNKFVVKLIGYPMYSVATEQG